MDCVNHSGVTATAFCQSCGKALCQNCVRTGPGGQVFCEQDWMAWQSFQQPFVPQVAPGAPNPAAAAVLGLIPGVGAMYNGQFFKGLIHVVIFAVLISITDHYGIFGIFIGAWVLYQSFEAYHTAKARRDGQPLPDPLGLNELGSWLNLGVRHNTWGAPVAGTNPGQGQGPMGQAPPAGAPGMGGYAPANPGYANPPYGGAGAPGGIYPGPIGGPIGGPASADPSAGYQVPPYGSPYGPPAGGFVDPAAPIPPIPAVPPVPWRRREPIGAIVLIALGLLFLMGQLDLFHGRLVGLTWPILLIGLGVWLVARRLGDSQGGPK
jgi:TM2 domain-containing membrane protein YozV